MAEKVKKYSLALVCVYMCYFTHGIQALVLSQNKVNFYTQWGITDPTAGAAAVSMAITWLGVGKLVSVWIGGELSDRVGRKPFAIAGSVLYVICFSIMLVTTDATVCCVAAFLSGVATSGFWDAALYPAAQEANPRYAASGVIGIKAAVSLMGIAYPIFVAANAAPDVWHINIYLPIALSVLCVIISAVVPFRFDDEKKTKIDDGSAQNAAQAEIQAQKDAMREQPNMLTQLVTLFIAFVTMYVMYGAQQYTKAYGMAYLGLDEMSAAVLTSVYTVGSLCAVLFWAFMMGKLRWNPLKVIFIDFVGSAVALAMVLVIPNVIGVYIAIAILGFCIAGGCLQTGLVVRQTLCPGPKGRNTGMYMTFMGVGSVGLPFFVAALTGSVGETTALYFMMISMLIFCVIGIVFCLYLNKRMKAQMNMTMNDKVD
ncbi:MAG: MFS transporter [Eggerthellales bacterium]|nr:MFS transporter [Eggerthellales bacterium]